MKKEKIFDIAVVGGGPAGMMAAGKAAQMGMKVILIEKNKKPGRKLLLTGNGRCNITYKEFDIRKLISFYGKKGGFLFSPFSFFGPKEVIDFFEKMKVRVKTERGKRVFPKSNKAESVLNALLRYLKRGEVFLLCGNKVHRVSHDKKNIEKLILQDKSILRAKKYIFCTGGMAYPSTGSTGEGLNWAASLTHKIEKQEPVLVPVKIKEKWVKNLQGLGLKNIELSVLQKGKKKKFFGECLFTHYGISGPVVLQSSQLIGDMLKKGEVKIKIDLKPALSREKLDSRIRRDFKKYSNKLFKNSLNDLLPSKIIPVLVDLSKINPEKKVNEIKKEERKKIVKLMKEMEMTVEELMGFDLAITTKGGVCLSEINEKTMQSKLIDNLFFAGEIIDINGPTGGFNLQICWSTGYLAGKSAAQVIKNEKDE